jgi:hypothetical protein
MVNGEFVIAENTGWTGILLTEWKNEKEYVSRTKE